MRQALQRAWLARGPLARLLWPLASLHRGVVALRRTAYRHGWLARERLPVPVVVVGNVVAGGAGKTPVVLALLSHLAAAGIAAGVVSRGYGRRGSDCREVQPGDTAAEAGDEPLLVCRRAQVPVFVAPRRADAGRALLQAHPGTRVIVCDDGLQHLALERDVELCVFDGRGTGNGWLLPAGPLREPWPREVDFVLHHGEPAGIHGFALHRRLAADAVRADGTRRPLAGFAGRAVVALAGIAQPEAFFAMLRERGITPTRTVPLADHAPIDARLPGIADDLLLCTEKDAVKLWRHHPGAWAVPLDLEVDPAFWPAFDRLLHAKL